MKVFYKAISAALVLSSSCLDFARAHPVVPDASGAELVQRAKPLLPSEDPWWERPANLSDYAPGDIIRARKPPFPLAAYNAPIKLAASWQLLYRTTDAFGGPLLSAITVMIPYNADLSRFLSYQTEIDAVYEGSRPSYTFQQGAQTVDNINSRYGIIWALPMLDQGFPVIIPDYVTELGAWVAGAVEGHAVLDGVRAARRSTSTTGIKSDAKAFGWGYSGGSHATLWAMELGESYAPDAVFEATALGGIPTDILAIIDNTNKGIAVGIPFTGILGVSKAYPEVQQLLDDELIPEKREKFYHATKQGLIPNVVEFAYDDIFSYFRNGSDTFKQPDVIKLLDVLSPGNGHIYQKPSYWYHATNDEVLPIKDIVALKDKYCAAGANIKFVEEEVGEHIILAVTGGYAALQFMTDRMQGKAFPKGCTADKVVTTVLDPRIWPYLVKQGFSFIKAFLGGAIGLASWVENGPPSV